MTMGINGNGRAQQSRGVEGRPAVTAPTLAEQVEKRLLGWKSQLLSLFPRDGEATYARAVTMAKDQARKLAASARPGDPPLDAQSIVECAVSAMKLDLEPGADCYFVPFKGKCTFIVGPQGLIKLMYRSGFVKSVTARYVLADDEFSYQLGTDEFVKHKRAAKRAIKPDAIWASLVAAYCIIETSTGGKVIEVIERGDIEYFRSLSPSGQSASGLWGKFPAEAARKAVLKQCAKGVPHSSQLAIALGVDADERSYEVPDEMLSAALGGEVPADMMPPDFEPEYDQNTGEMRDAREPGAEG